MQLTAPALPAIKLKHAAIAAAGLILAGLIMLVSDPADIVRQAAGITDESNPTGAPNGGLKNFVNAANSLLTPAMVAMAAITPLACIVGAGAMMFGNKKGMVIVGSALGALVFVASIKGIVA